jgi:spore coat polysaccharide biosynthesis protein SpsF
MYADIFIPVTLGSKRLHQKHLKEIDGKPLLKYLIERLESCKKIRNIVICTTNSKTDDQLVSFLQKENILVFRGSDLDILTRFLDAAKYFGTEIIIDVEGDKIYTDPKYVDLIVNSLQNSDVDFITGNDSLEKFDPTFWFHGFVPAGFKVNALAKICELKKTNNTETGYKEFFTSNNIIKCKFLLPESDISIPKKNRFTLDYPEDYELCKKIFQELGNNFGVKEVINLIKTKPELQKIIGPAIEKWEKSYKKDLTDFSL